jgi:hypothetical protein
MEDRHAAIATSRILTWLVSGWGCRGRRLSRNFKTAVLAPNEFTIRAEDLLFLQSCLSRETYDFAAQNCDGRLGKCEHSLCGGLD